MATYVYETIPQADGEPVRTYEIKQSMKDPALARHPDTGEPIRRVIMGGAGVMGLSKTAPIAKAGASCCGPGCGCH